VVVYGTWDIVMQLVLSKNWLFEERSALLKLGSCDNHAWETVRVEVGDVWLRQFGGDGGR